MERTIHGPPRDILVRYHSENREKIKVVSGLTNESCEDKTVQMFATKVYVNGVNVMKFTEDEFRPEDMPLLRQRLEELAQQRFDSEELLIDLVQYSTQLRTHENYTQDKQEPWEEE